MSEAMAGVNLVQSIYRVYQDALGKDQTWPWEQMPREVRAGWMAVAERCAAKIRSYEGLSVRQVAAAFFDAFVAGAGFQDEGLAYDVIIAREQIAWQAIVRYVAILADYDPEEYGPLSDVEASWGRWARERMSMLSGVGDGECHGI